jgi:RHS repeat-associated protein
VYDGWSLLEERNASGVEQARYYHGAMIDELLLRITANTHYYHHDGLGSTIALTDSTGALVESYTYDVFGTTSILSTNLQLLATSAVGNRFLFTGREYLAEIGLYDYRNRFYSQSLGRFLQTDPIGFEAKDVNLYRYVSNNPANYFDPNGTVTHTDTCEKKDDVGKVKTGTDEVKIELSGASNPILNKVKKVYDTFKPDYAPDSDRLQRLASGLLQMLSSVGTPFDLTATAKWTQCVCNAGKYSWENKEVSKKLDTFYFNDPDLGRKMRDAIDNFSEGVFP